VKWRDVSADIAVIEIVEWDKFKSDNPIEYLEFNTDYLQGDKVIVLGNPSGLLFSASLGIVSQERQKLTNSPMFYLGSDAHLYPGNSGGPMLDKNGDVLSVSDLMLPMEGGSYGFGIPAGIVQKVLRDFAKYGEVRWATLGVTMDDNKITDVAIGSAAEKAGIKVNDLVDYIIVDNVKVDVKTAADISDELAQRDYQDTVRLYVNNDHEVDLVPGYKTSKDFPPLPHK
jgi:S1-C subfamily serine protease